jgi:hypothetical protein
MGLRLVQKGATAVSFMAGVDPPAPLVLAALAIWVMGTMMASNGLELLD